MNRLIIVGNGWDLAHGMPTAYPHFIKNYLVKVLQKFFVKGKYEDPLISFKPRIDGYMPYKAEVNPENCLKLLKRIPEADGAYVSVTIKSQFLKATLEHVEQVNWVDLENLYFETLLKSKNQSNFNYADVTKLNLEFDFIKNELEDYLNTLEKEFEVPFSDELAAIFTSLIDEKEIVQFPKGYISGMSFNPLPEFTMILNFNYTKTLHQYWDHCVLEKRATVLNYIHGELKCEENPIIFGFGDEYDKNYLEFEDMRNHELWKHIKTFGYSKTTNYQDLIRFADSDIFQVFVFGHSLGISDRTMLREIFEHDNCVTIKFFYYQKSEKENDYQEKQYNAYYHFSNKALPRKKIVPFAQSKAMPQVVFKNK